MQLLTKLVGLFIFFGLYGQGICQDVNEKAVLENLVNTFLNAVDSKEMHDRFWAEDLIYTSSSGKRFGKGTIMAGFESNNENSGSSPTYSAENMQIQLYENVAVVAFKLVSVNPDNKSTSEYLNSGTFVKRNNLWVVVNWQATKIPPNE